MAGTLPVTTPARPQNQQHTPQKSQNTWEHMLTSKQKGGLAGIDALCPSLGPPVAGQQQKRAKRTQLSPLASIKQWGNEPNSETARRSLSPRSPELRKAPSTSTPAHLISRGCAHPAASRARSAAKRAKRTSRRKKSGQKKSGQPRLITGVRGEQ
jgi:hypothetical protein